MERDFMGLNSKDSVVVIKEETVETGMDSGSSVFPKCPAVHWPSTNKVSALPHFMSIKGSQEEKLVKGVSDPLASPVVKAMISGDEIQGVPISMNNPFMRSHFASPVQNFVGATVKQQFLAGAPITATHGILPSNGTMARTNELWFNAKISGAPAQLTVFYAGTVNVYNDISPEKAQAIMFLAGNSSAAGSNVAQPRGQVQAANSKQAVGDGAFVNPPVITTACSGLPSPMSVTSHPTCRFSNNDETIVAKTNGISMTPGNVETQKMVTSFGSVTPTTMIPVAVPQARKASLARFLEKRKERVMNSSPYNLSKKTPEYLTPDSTGIGFSATSGVSSGSLNQQGE